MTKLSSLVKVLHTRIKTKPPPSNTCRFNLHEEKKGGWKSNFQMKGGHFGNWRLRRLDKEAIGGFHRISTRGGSIFVNSKSGLSDWSGFRKRGREREGGSWSRYLETALSENLVWRKSSGCVKRERKRKDGERENLKKLCRLFHLHWILFSLFLPHFYLLIIKPHNRLPLSLSLYLFISRNDLHWTHLKAVSPLMRFSRAAAEEEIEAKLLVSPFMATASKPTNHTSHLELQHQQQQQQQHQQVLDHHQMSYGMMQSSSSSAMPGNFLY